MKARIAAGGGVACVVMLVVSACSLNTQGSSDQPTGSRDVITESELSSVDAVNAYTAVQQLRPMWLRTRGPTSLRGGRANLPTVYVDNMRFGELETLHNIPLDEIAEIRYINGPDATIRWGTGVVGGVIEVIRKTS